MSCPWDEPDHNPREWRQALQEARAEHARRLEEAELLYRQSSQGPTCDGMRTGPCKSTEPDRGAAEQRAWPPGQRAYKQRWKTLDQASQSVYQEDDHEDSDAEGTDSGADDCQSDGQQSEHDSAASDGESVQCEEAEGSASYQADHVEFVASAPYDDGSSLNQDYGYDFEQDYGSDYDQDYGSDYDQDYSSDYSSDY